MTKTCPNLKHPPKFPIIPDSNSGTKQGASTLSKDNNIVENLSQDQFPPVNKRKTLKNRKLMKL